MVKRKRLLKLLIDKDMTQSELARKIGVSFQSVNMWVSGKRNPSYESVPKIAKALGITTDEVIDALLS